MNSIHIRLLERSSSIYKTQTTVPSITTAIDQQIISPPSENLERRRLAFPPLHKFVDLSVCSVQLSLTQLLLEDLRQQEQVRRHIRDLDARRVQRPVTVAQRHAAARLLIRALLLCDGCLPSRHTLRRRRRIGLNDSDRRCLLHRICCAPATTECAGVHSTRATPRTADSEEFIPPCAS